MYAPSTASGAQWMTRITCLHASGYLRHRVPLRSMEPIVGGRRMPQAADGADEGTDGASTGTNDAVAAVGPVPLQMCRAVPVQM